eukprot:110389-Pleurochrysis_carterae.AAC.1
MFVCARAVVVLARAIGGGGSIFAHHDLMGASTHEIIAQAPRPGLNSNLSLRRDLAPILHTASSPLLQPCFAAVPPSFADLRSSQRHHEDPP